MTIHALQSSPEGLILQEENIKYQSHEALQILSALSDPSTPLFQIDKADFNMLCEHYEGKKGVTYPSYDGISQSALRNKKPQSNVEILTIKQHGKIVAARFNTTSLKSDDIQNIFYFKAG